MNAATKKALNNVEITIVPVKQPKVMFDIEHLKVENFIIKPNYIKIWHDDVTIDVYKRIKDSCYWRCVGLKGKYEFALLVKVHI